MARTNRASTAAPSANVDALDNIDLDDMFADDGDALFDGLDMDLGHMDDFGGGDTGGGGLGSSSAATTAAISTQRLSPQGMPSEPLSPAVDDDDDDDDDGLMPTAARRTTKRKSKYPAFFNDIDEGSEHQQQWQPSHKRSKFSKDEVPSGETKSSKSSKTKVKGSNSTKKNSKKPQNDDLKHQQTLPQYQSSQIKDKNIASSNSNKLLNASSMATSKMKINLRAGNSGIGLPMPPAPPIMGMMTTRGSGTMTLPSTVAAAGQFGGRNKRTISGSTTTIGSASFSALPKITTTMKSNKLPLMSSRSSTDGAIETDLSKRIRKQNQQQQSHDQPQQSKSEQAMPKHKFKSTTKESSVTYTSLPPSVQAPLSASSATILKVRREIPEKAFCGIKPSDRTYYPFMPALPTEPTMKSKKDCGLLDRAHSMFANYLANNSLEKDNFRDKSSAIESQPIMKLLEEVFKDDVKQNSLTEESETSATRRLRTGAICAAVTTVRKTIRQFDRNVLAEDLFNVCSLLQKQHDFLQQNAKNMQRWCKNNFSQEDYLSLYKSSKKTSTFSEDDIAKPQTVLESFRRRELKVRIICEGFKEPTTSSKLMIPSPLVAQLPPRFAPPPPTPLPPPPTRSHESSLIDNSKSLLLGSSPMNKSKKRKLLSTPPSTSKAGAAVTKKALLAYGILPPETKQNPQINIYSTIMKPMKRRKCISDLLSKTAREIESEHRRNFNQRRISIDRHEQSMQNIIDDDISKVQFIHTTGMWKYIEHAGYFQAITEAELQERLNEIKFNVDWDNGKSRMGSTFSEAIQTGVDDRGTGSETSKASVMDRLQSLLAFENHDSIGEVDTGAADDVDYDDDDISMNELFHCMVDEFQSTPPLSSQPHVLSYTPETNVDLSQLTLEERAFLHLRCADLVVDDRLFHTAIPKPPLERVQNGPNGKTTTNKALVSSDSTANQDAVASNYNNERFVNGFIKVTQRSIPNDDGAAVTISVENSHRNTLKGEVDDVIDTMIVDFHRKSKLNNRRIAYLESVALNCTDLLVHECKARDDYETTTIAKCQQLLRKSKAEQKAKTEKAKSSSDGLALPW